MNLHKLGIKAIISIIAVLKETQFQSKESKHRDVSVFVAIWLIQLKSCEGLASRLADPAVQQYHQEVYWSVALA